MSRDLPDRAVRPECHVVLLAPLVVKRGIETEGAHAPARVETDRVAILVERRVARRRTAAERCGRVGPGIGSTCEVAVDHVVPGPRGRHAIGVEPREQRLQLLLMLGVNVVTADMPAKSPFA